MSGMDLDTSKVVHFAHEHWPYLAVPVGLYTFSKFAQWLLPGPQHNPRLTFKDKTVLITGASSGLGKTLAIDLYKKGAKLILTARSLDKLKELCEELPQKYGPNPHEPVYRYLDVADPTEVEDLAKFAIDGKTIDILINNAGSSMRGSIEETPMEIQRQVMEVNYFGQIAITRALLPHIPDDGCIIVTSSLQGRIAVPYRSAYAASKHALQAYFDTLRMETRPKLHILVVSAGYMNTGFGSRALDKHGKPTGKEDPNQAKGMSAEESSREILRAAAARETDLLMAPWFHRIGVFARWAWPDFFFYFGYRRGLKDEYAKKTQ